MFNPDVLIIGAGVAGMQASLLLAQAGRKVVLIEKEPLIGGQTIKYEEVYPNLECATCMVSPIQQDILQSSLIELHLLSEIESVTGEAGNFSVTIAKKARYVSLENCIGCDACFEPCPVELDNPFEENLGRKKAISVPCPGALPNVPAIDPIDCLRLNGKKKDCSACKDACMFDAVDFDQSDETLEIKVGSILVAVGFDMLDLKPLTDFGYGTLPGVYSAMEFERLFAANGPTEGDLILRDGKTPTSIAVVHCVGRKEVGYCSGLCCMYSTKLSHFLKNKLHDAEVREFHTDLCVPGKTHQEFYLETQKLGVEFIRYRALQVAGRNGGMQVNYEDENGEKKTQPVDMVILSQAMIPRPDSAELAERLGIQREERGFFATLNSSLSPVETGKEGIYVVGCAGGPMDIPESVAQAEAAVGKILLSGMERIGEQAGDSQ